MGVRELPCWEITKCASEQNCLCRRQEGQAKECWEIARQFDDFRSALNVCKDCLVYISKQESSMLSEEELEKIVSNKVECALMTACP